MSLNFAQDSLCLQDSITNLKGRTGNIEKNLENVVKLFFAVQGVLRNKLTLLKRIQNCSMEFLGNLSCQVDILKDTLNENMDSFDDSLIFKSTLSDSGDFSKQSEVRLTEIHPEENEKIFKKIIEEKQLMEKELREADKILLFLEQFTAPKKIQKIDDMLKPDKILEKVDLDEFLTQANTYFENEKFELVDGIDTKMKTLENSHTRLETNLNGVLASLKNDPNGTGLKNSVKRIIELQKELKDKDSEIIILKKKVFSMEAKISNTSLDQTRSRPTQELNENVEKKMNELEAECSTLRSALLKQRRESDESTIPITLELSNLSQKLKESESHNNKLEDLNLVITELEESLALLKKENSILQEECFNLKKENVNMFNQIQSSKDETKRDELTSQINNLQEKLKIARLEILEAEGRIEGMQQESCRCPRVDLDLQELIDDLNSENINQLEYLDNKIESFKSNNAQILEENYRLKSELTELTSIIEELRNTPQEERKSMPKNRISFTPSIIMQDFKYEEYGMLKDENEKLKRMNASLNKGITTLNLDNKALKAHNEDLVKRVRRNSRQRSGSSGRLNQSQSVASISTRNEANEPSPELRTDLLGMIYLQAISLESEINTEMNQMILSKFQN